MAYSNYHKAFVFDNLLKLLDIMDLDSDLLACLLQKRLITQEQQDLFTLPTKTRKGKTTDFLFAMTKKPLNHWREVMDSVRERQPHNGQQLDDLWWSYNPYIHNHGKSFMDLHAKQEVEDKVAPDEMLRYYSPPDPPIRQTYPAVPDPTPQQIQSVYGYRPDPTTREEEQGAYGGYRRLVEEEYTSYTNPSETPPTYDDAVADMAYYAPPTYDDAVADMAYYAPPQMTHAPPPFYKDYDMLASNIWYESIGSHLISKCIIDLDEDDIIRSHSTRKGKAEAMLKMLHDKVLSGHIGVHYMKNILASAFDSQCLSFLKEYL